MRPQSPFGSLRNSRSADFLSRRLEERVMPQILENLFEGPRGFLLPLFTCLQIDGVLTKRQDDCRMDQL